MPTTQRRQSSTRRVQIRRQQPQPGRFDALRNLRMPSAVKRGRRGRQSSGLMTTLTSAARSLRGTGKSRRAKQGGGKGRLFALVAGAGATAFATRRASQRKTTPDSAPAESPPTEPQQAA